MTLTDAHLVLLSAAAQHPDQLLTRPERLAGGAAQKVAVKLVKAGLAEEVSVRTDQPCWGKDEDSRLVGLRITPAGLAAIGIKETEVAAQLPSPAAEQPQDDRTGPSPRPGTKQALIIGLLQRPEGASLDELTAATGWLPHTTRAALTRLRQAGYGLAKSKGEDGYTCYRIDPLREPAPEPAGSVRED
jgi:hypothetical protein